MKQLKVIKLLLEYVRRLSAFTASIPWATQYKTLSMQNTLPIISSLEMPFNADNIKKLSEDLIKINGSTEYGGGESSGGQSIWTIHYKTTGYQEFLDSFYHELETDGRQNKMPYSLNQLSNYLCIISWILVCVYLINKAYIKDLITKRYLVFFICHPIFILGVFATGKHTPEESMILLNGIMILLSKFYSQNYFKKKL